MARWFGLALVAMLSCQAQKMVTLLDSGNPSNRVDLVIVGDGYTAVQQSKFQTDADNFLTQFFNGDPYLTYKSYFNVHALFVASNQSGADHPPATVDTAFDATYNCTGIERLICVNTTKVTAALVNAGVPPAMRDITLVLVNDTEYGGSGGAVAVTSLDPSAPEIVLHEVGHTFGLLADEYSDSPPACDTSIEPRQPDVTLANTRDTIKWKVWIDASTPVPTNSTQLGIPGAYLGAQYCVSGKYRPTYDSKMRSLGRPFEQINSEQLVKRIYNLVSPIDSTVPLSGGSAIESRTFSVNTLVNPALVTQWTLDGKNAGTGAGFTVPDTDTCPHQVSVTVSDPTTMVRTDSAGLLRKSVGWTYYPAALEPIAASTSEIYNAAAGSSGKFVPPDSWVTLKGVSLALALDVPSDGVLRTNIDGVIVKVTDSAGIDRFARLQFVSPGQINFILPPDTALGTAKVQVCRPGASTTATNLGVTRIAPGLFAANSNGTGLAAANVLRVKSDGTQVQQLVADGPVAPGSDGIYLTLYGTGLRNPSDARNTKVTVGGISMVPLYAGSQNQFDALDQVNVGPLPASAMTPGLKDIFMEVDGIPSNIVQVEFK